MTAGKKNAAVLTRDKATGDYYSKDGRLFIEKCLHGYDVSTRNPDTGEYEYTASVDRLDEARLF